MSLLVVTYPVLSQTDYQWVQTIRATHDTLYYHVVAPHFTLVFPVESLAQEPFVAHIARQIRGVPPFRFVLRCAVLHQDPFTPSTQVFLVPDEGYSQFVKLHDRLYTGPLAPALRLDLPFIPHITVANSADPHAGKRVAETLNAQDFAIGGRVETLEVVWYDGTRVATVEQFLLAERRSGVGTDAGSCGRTA
jgi:2'-5' RNA ligase